MSASGIVQQRGVALVAALFLIVAVAALGGFALRINAGQQQNATLDILTARATAAANSGLEWGIYRLMVNKACAASKPLPMNSAHGALNGFTVTVQCLPRGTVHKNDGIDVLSYRMVADAQRGTYGKPDFVRRSASMMFNNPP